MSGVPRTTSFGPAFFFEVFRRRVGVVIVSTIAAVALTIPVIFLIHKHYKASTKILISDPVLSGNTTVQEPLFRRDQDTATKLGNINNLVKSDLFLIQAVAKLNSDGYESSASPQWTPTAEKVKDSVTAVLDQSSLEITVDTPNPDVSIKLAKILGEQFKEWRNVATATAANAAVLIPVNRDGIELVDDWDGLGQRLTAEGKMVSGEGLLPSETATTLRDGVLSDGPYAESREQLGGLYIVDCADLDEALSIAKQVPTSPGLIIEVRPAMS